MEMSLLVDAGIVARKAAALNLRKLSDITMPQHHQPNHKIIYLRSELLEVVKRQGES